MLMLNSTFFRQEIYSNKISGKIKDRYIKFGQKKVATFPSLEHTTCLNEYLGTGNLPIEKQSNP